MPPYGPFVQRAPMTFSPVGHSVDQRFNVPSAVRGHERLHSFTYNQAGVFLFHDFFKKDWRSDDFWVSLYFPIILTSVPGVRRQINAAGSRFYPVICLEPGIEERDFRDRR
jgi:hypothetical protein